MFDELLSSQTVDQLKPRLALLETGERPSRKADIIALLRRHLLSPQLRAYWEKLEPVDRHAVAEAIHNWDGRFDPIRFSNKYADLPQAFRPREPGGSRRSREKIGTLYLFFYDYIVPDELCARLKAFVPAPKPDTMKTTTDDEMPDAHPPAGEKYPEHPAASPFRVRRAAMETVVRHDLPALLHLVDNGQIEVSDKTGLATAATLRIIDTVLMGGDFYATEDERGRKQWDPGPLRPIRPYAWPLLLQSSGLAKLSFPNIHITYNQAANRS